MQILILRMRLVTAYQPNYFSVEDIIATQAPVPCKIDVRIPRLGDLDPSSQSSHLEPGRRLEIPTWLAFSLTRRRLISPELNKSYNQNSRDILKAEAVVVDLVKQESYFYELGQHMCSLITGGEEEELRDTLVQTFEQRSREILSLSQAALCADVQNRERLLSREEKALVVAGRQRWSEIDNWLAGKVSSAELAAVSVASYRKRKRRDDDD